MSEKISNLTSATFKAAVAASGQPVLVDFWASWCGPCKAIAPILEELAVEWDGKLTIAKVNSDEEQALAAEYGVRSIPTLLLFKGGKVADQIVGFTPKAALKARLAPHLAA
jgi:thioredoxin 1